MDSLMLEFLGYHHEASGDLFYMTRGDERARVYVDSIGQTWVDIRRIPEDGYFHTQPVSAWRAFGGSEIAARTLTAEGFHTRRFSRHAHYVVEREDGPK